MKDVYRQRPLLEGREVPFDGRLSALASSQRWPRLHRRSLPEDRWAPFAGQLSAVTPRETVACGTGDYFLVINLHNFRDAIEIDDDDDHV